MTLLSSTTSSGLSSEDLLKLKHFVIDNLTRELEIENPPFAQREAFVKKKLVDVFNRLQAKVPESIRQQLTRDVLDDVLGYGPIQPLLNDPEVDEVMVNGPKKIYVERKGKLVKTAVNFENDEQVLRVIDRI